MPLAAPVVGPQALRSTESRNVTGWCQNVFGMGEVFVARRNVRTLTDGGGVKGYPRSRQEPEEGRCGTGRVPVADQEPKGGSSA